MNKIYKVVFNQTLQVFQVVSEFAKGHSKAETPKALKKNMSPLSAKTWTAVLAAVGILSGGFVFAADTAAVTVSNGTNTTATSTVDATDGHTDYKVNLNDAISLSSVTTGNTVMNTNGVTIGSGSTAVSLTSTGLNNGGNKITNVAAGTADTDAVNKGQMTNAIDESMKYFKANSTGTEASATGSDAVAVGSGAVSGGSEAVALGLNTAADGDQSLALGVNAGTSSGTTGAIAVGNTAKASQNGAVAIGQNSAANGKRSTVVGDSAQAVGDQALALGASASASGTNGTALGTSASTAGSSATAVGSHASAAGGSAAAIGDSASASGGDSVALGASSQASGTNDISLGASAGVGTQSGSTSKTQQNRISIGANAGQNGSGNENTAIGLNAGDNVSGNFNVAMGSSAGGATSGDDNTAIGYEANKNGSGSHSTAVGASTTASSAATALGYKAAAVGNNSVAVGYAAQANGSSGVAVGDGAKAADNSIALGHNSAASRSDSSGNAYLTGQAAGIYGVVSVGSSEGDITFQRRIINVADGSNGTDAVNVNQLKAAQTSVATLIGGGVTLNTDGSYGQFSLTDKNGTVHSYDTLAAALGAVTSDQIQVATADAVTYTDGNKTNINANGTISKVTAATSSDQAVNLGQMNSAIAASQTKYYSVNSNESGNQNNTGATGENAIAAGPAATAVGDRSISIGDNTKAQGTNSIAIGNSNTTSDRQATAYGQSSIAIGSSASSAGNNSIALGNYALTEVQNSTSTTVNSAIAIGDQAQATSDQAVALGKNAHASGVNAFAQGNTSSATNESSIAVGTNASSSGTASTVIGKNSAVSGTHSGLIGTSMSTDTNQTGQALTGSDTYVVGNGNGTVGGTNSSIMGNSNTVGTTVTDPNGITHSYNTVNTSILGNSNTVTAQDADVIGHDNTVGKKNLNAAGIADGTIDTAAGSGVFGGNNTVYGSGNRIIGNNNTDSNLDGVFILGNNVTAGLADSVYLGNNSAYVIGSDASSSTTAGVNSYSSVTIGSGNYTFAGANAAGVVTVGSVGSERRIQNVAAGLVSANSTDAVNGSQLYTMTRPLRFAGDNSTIGTTSGSDVNVLHRGSDQAMSLLGGADGDKLSDNNIGVVADAANNKMTVKLAKDVTGLNSITSKNVNAETVKAGDTTVNNQGVTIAGGPSVTKEGINANGTKITNVAAGTEDTDAVNVSQLTKQSADLTEKGFGLKDQDGNIVHKSLGKDIEVTGDGKNISTKVENGTMKVVLNDDLNVNSVTTADADGNQTVTQGSGMTVTDKDGNETTIGAGGITITPKDLAPGTSSVSLTKNGLDNGGNQIHNVAAGTAGTDAVNVSQLQDEIAKNATKLADGKNTTVTGTGTTENPYKVNVNDNLNLGEKGENGIDGSIGVTGKDGSAVTINGKDGSIGMNGKDGKDGLTMKSAKGQDGVDGSNGANGMTRIVYEDDGHVPHEVATLDDGLKFAGNTGSVAKKLNSTMTIKGNGTKEDKEYDASNIKTVVDAQGDLVIGLDKNLKADTVTVGGQGKDGADGINGAIGVKGADGKDGVTISSIGKDGTNGTDGHIGINGKDGASADIHVVKGANGVDGTDGYNGTDGIDRIVYEDHNGNTQTVATMNDGMKYGGDVGNVINKKLNGQVNVVGGITDSSKLSTEDNIGVVSDGSDNLKVRLSKDLKGLDSVTTKTVTADTGNITTVNASTVNVGDTTITTGGMTIQNGSAGQDVTLNKDGLNNGGNKITNVAPGDISSTSTDAVNGSQLYGTETRINRLGNRINHVGAGAAALAGLHPLDFDPDDKWDFAAGYGNYKNANAVAIGAYYRPNEDTMFSVGGSFSGGENMVNVGVSWKFGQKSHISRSRVSMAKDMLAMKNQIETLTKKLAAYESGQPVKLAPIATGAMTFPDVPENHWAYEYVKNLAERGYLKGYPDGEFKGDRAMTRYEYAAIIYRALQNGAPSDGNMTRSVDDFGPELVKVQNIDRFRVDRISGKDNDRHKVERVRVNDKDDKAQNVYRDVYGNHIQK